jgi:ubiquinone/menaquinone biosynthesis C-methylase UbiE
MAEYAGRRLRASSANASVLVGDVTEVLSETPDAYFDVATMVLALHEMPAETRGPVLQEVTRVARRLLCLEYRVPMPWNLPGARNRFVEALAGVEHFRAFRDFSRLGGSRAVASAAGLLYENIRYPDKGTFDVSEIRATPR